ncbi:MAG: pilin [Candidatus Uhrbacteria bacterium]|nr:pilin [Candidatus Uhrbacteria bacterium]
MSREQKKQQKVFFLTLFAGSALFFVASFFFFDSVNAQIPDAIVPQCKWEQGETYGLGAFILLAANAMKFIWGIAGSLALLMFVWGGFQWLTAAGEEARVKAGWDTFMNATIGIGIIFGSWVAINTVILFLVSPPGTFTTAQLFGRADWVTIATEKNTVCINSAKLVGGSVPKVTPVNPTQCKDIEAGSTFFPLPSGGSCQKVCFDEAVKKGESAAKIADLVDGAGKKGGCCCVFGSIAAGPGIVSVTKQGHLNEPCIAGVDLLALGGTPSYDVGQWTCRSQDMYCDSSDTSQSLHGTCKNKKTGNETCSISSGIECLSGKCTSSLCEGVAGQNTAQ